MNQWTTHLTEHETLLVYLSQTAERNGYILNPDQEGVEKVVGLMTENLMNAGRRFCTCKQSRPLNPEKDIICPCPTLKAEIDKDGHCFCRLYYRKAGQNAT